jgi:hypothetical protein
MKLPCAGRWFESIFGDENSEYNAGSDGYTISA